MFIYENGGFRKRFPEWRLLKTQVYRISVDGKTEVFKNALVRTGPNMITSQKRFDALGTRMKLDGGKGPP